MHRTYISSSKQAREGEWGKEFTTEKATNAIGNRLEQTDIDTGSLLRIAEAIELLTIGHKVLVDEIKTLKLVNNNLHESLSDKDIDIKELQKTVKKMKRAIRWACGEIGHFEKPDKNMGIYWWRIILKKKAGLKK